ncbi:MAG: alanine racemase [Clostridia bacterium]|nr:alanine racemase [Clostridia bacterium]
MNAQEYPVLEVDLSAIRSNAACVCGIWAGHGIGVAGVFKGTDGSPQVARAMLEGGCAQLASSRIGHLADLRDLFPGTPMMLLRIPQLCEADDVVRYADLSLNSELRTLKALNEAAAALGRTHRVILMLDIGDRREGAVSVEDLAALAESVKRDLPHISVAGVGTNYGCVSGVLPDDDNLAMLCRGADAVESVLGMPLEIVSGGSSSMLIRWSKGLAIPEKINNLRVGGYILNPINMRLNRGVNIPEMNEDTLRLRAQVVEAKDKSGAGHTGKNWKGETVNFTDDGVRRRAIVALGTQDIGDPFNLLPVDPAVHVIACSSDHTILDVTDCEKRVETGGLLEFRLRYGALLQIFSTRHVRIAYK